MKMEDFKNSLATHPQVLELTEKDSSITPDKAIAFLNEENPCFGCFHRPEFEKGTSYAQNRCPHCKKYEFYLREGLPR